MNIKYLGADLITSERFGAQDGNMSRFPATLNSAGSQCVPGLNLGVPLTNGAADMIVQKSQ